MTGTLIVVAVCVVITIVLFMLVASKDKASLDEQAECIRRQLQDMADRKRQRDEKRARRRER